MSEKTRMSLRTYTRGMWHASGRQFASKLLVEAVGNPAARFREGQWEAIDAVVNRRRRIIVVERTGWGKSMVYFLATCLLRQQGSGPTLVISPLLALMRNQVEAAKQVGLIAETINSSNYPEWPSITERLVSSSIDLLLISPERLANKHFLETVLERVASHIGMVVIDEVHCISDWGHDFRPDYRRIVNILRFMPSNTPVLGTTATANNRVLEDIQAQLGDFTVQRGPLTRDSLVLQTLQMPDQATRLAWLAEYIPKLNGTGIVYTLTKRDAMTVSAWLLKHGIKAACYHSGVKSEERPNSTDERLYLEESLLKNRIEVLVATSALGMGYDKPDLAFAIHYQAPGSVIAYYQQVGRAGRALERAAGILLAGKEDVDIIEYFRNNAFPPEEDVNQLLALLDANDGMSVPDIEKNLNMRHGRIAHLLKFLSVETPSPVIKMQHKWHRTAVRYQMDKERIDRLTKQREVEWQEIQRYLKTGGCRMAYLQHALNDPRAGRCGRCDNCKRRHSISPKVGRRQVLQALYFLRNMELPIKPRIRIPSGVCPQFSYNGYLLVRLRASEGRVLSRWGDAGWGRYVRQGKSAGHFSDELVAAAAKMVSRWQPTPAPQWVTCIPSSTKPRLVSSFANRLSQRLGLPFMETLVARGSRPPQKEQQNSFHQCRNVEGAFSVRPQVPHTPVLLIDDAVDSRWTFTMAAAKLREAGCGKVFPMALASTASD